jgi:uncharacterized membrane protein
MNIAVWIVSGLLAAAYLFAGTNKATRPKDKLVDSLPWAEDLSPATIKFIGIMEILGAIGLILPWLTGIAAVLTPLAATGLVILQMLAIIVHLRRHEAKVVPMNTILLLVSCSPPLRRDPPLHRALIHRSSKVEPCRLSATAGGRKAHQKDGPRAHAWPQLSPPGPPDAVPVEPLPRWS